MENKNKYNYNYLVVYAYYREKFSFELLGSFNNLGIGNVPINANKQVKDWTCEDFEKTRELIAKTVGNLKKEQVIILNMIEKAVEEYNEDEKPKE